MARMVFAMGQSAFPGTPGEFREAASPFVNGRSGMTEDCEGLPDCRIALSVGAYRFRQPLPEDPS